MGGHQETIVEYDLSQSMETKTVRKSLLCRSLIRSNPTFSDRYILVAPAAPFYEVKAIIESVLDSHRVKYISWILERIKKNRVSTLIPDPCLIWMSKGIYW